MGEGLDWVWTRFGLSDPNRTNRKKSTWCQRSQLMSITINIVIGRQPLYNCSYAGSSVFSGRRWRSTGICAAHSFPGMYIPSNPFIADHKRMATCSMVCLPNPVFYRLPTGSRRYIPRPKGAYRHLNVPVLCTLRRGIVGTRARRELCESDRGSYGLYVHGDTRYRLTERKNEEMLM